MDSISDLGIHLFVDDEIVGLFPESITHGFGSGNDVLSHGLGRASNGLSLADLQLVVETLGNHAATGVRLVSCIIKGM